jgi:hypothetical protein
MAHGVVTQQACGGGITHVLCHLKTKLGLSAVIVSALHFRQSGFLFLLDRKSKPLLNCTSMPPAMQG